MTESSTDLPEFDPAVEEQAKRASKAAAWVLVTRLAAATNQGLRRSFVEDTSETAFTMRAVASSSQVAEVAEEIRTELRLMFFAALRDHIEDGLPNAITKRLPELLNRDFNATVTGLTAALESGAVSESLAAEALKELGQVRNDAFRHYHRWALERALSLGSSMTRDGAGLGLARLGDPAAIPYLLKAIDAEPNLETRADLQLVVDQLRQQQEHAAPPPQNQ